MLITVFGFCYVVDFSELPESRSKFVLCTMLGSLKMSTRLEDLEKHNFRKVIPPPISILIHCPAFTPTWCLIINSRVDDLGSFKAGNMYM